MCFYSTAGCSAAGDGRPGLATVLLLAGFAVVALVRARRQRNRS
jgi:MYXO-CTERM domain-containing protein